MCNFELQFKNKNAALRDRDGYLLFSGVNYHEAWFIKDTFLPGSELKGTSHDTCNVLRTIYEYSSCTIHVAPFYINVFKKIKVSWIISQKQTQTQFYGPEFP